GIPPLPSPSAPSRQDPGRSNWTPRPLRRTGSRPYPRRTPAWRSRRLLEWRGESYRDFRVMDLPRVIHAQAELGRVLDVARLSNEPVDVRIILPIRERGAEVFHIALPNGNRALLLPLVIDHIDEKAVHRDGV